jgi:hypothetical protein
MLSGEPGVREVRASRRVLRLMMIRYDPKVVTAQHLHHRIREHGVHASLIGL